MGKMRSAPSSEPSSATATEDPNPQAPLPRPEDTILEIEVLSTKGKIGRIGTVKSNVQNQTKVENGGIGTSKPSEGIDSEVTAGGDELVASLNKKLQDVAHLSAKACIFRVPRALRQVNEEAYTPQVVSIGPYHHGQEKLKPMEEHKMRYLSHFFSRGLQSNLEVFVGNLRDMEIYARDYYGQNIKESSNTLVEMMLLDGCFIIELFFKFWEQEKQVLTMDPIFHIASMITAIRVDMLLLENQLPFDILQHLFILATGDDEMFRDASFLELTLTFFNFKYLLNMAEGSAQIDSTSGIHHFLDLLRMCSLPSYPMGLVSKKECRFISSATELHEAGVKFKKASGNSIFDLTFRNGIFEIPALTIEDTTEALFRNLIAFEQCSEITSEQYITQYLALMDFLINSPRDVEILRRSGIIDNWLGDNEQVSLLFNKIFVGVTIFANTFYFHRLAESVNDYYNTPWHSLRAMLDREYFHSPWSTASSIAVIIVVLCAIIQTVCTVISTAR